MSINVTAIDNKYKTKKQKDVKRQMEFSYMERNPSQKALDKFKEEPDQLRYAREYGKDRTKCETEKNIDKEQS